MKPAIDDGRQREATGRIVDAISHSPAVWLVADRGGGGRSRSGGDTWSSTLDCLLASPWLKRRLPLELDVDLGSVYRTMETIVGVPTMTSTIRTRRPSTSCSPPPPT